MGLGPSILELKQRLWPAIVRCQKFRPKPLGRADIQGKNLNFGPNFLETGKLWSTYFGTIGKHSASTTRHWNFVSQSSKTKKFFWGGQILTMIPIFSKLVNFGPHISTFLDSPREGLQATKISWAKFQKQKSFE